VSESCS